MAGRPHDVVPRDPPSRPRGRQLRVVRLADIAIPYASDWKPGAVALGVLGAWLLVAVELTSLAMRRLPRKLWRVVHLSSYVAFWLTSMHGAFAGTDASSWLYRGGAIASIVAVAWALMYRVANRRSARRAARLGGLPTSVV